MCKIIKFQKKKNVCDVDFDIGWFAQLSKKMDCNQLKEAWYLGLADYIEMQKNISDKKVYIIEPPEKKVEWEIPVYAE